MHERKFKYFYVYGVVDCSSKEFYEWYIRFEKRKYEFFLGFKLSYEATTIKKIPKRWNF